MKLVRFTLRNRFGHAIDVRKTTPGYSRWYIAIRIRWNPIALLQTPQGQAICS
jgi:hypothetical protein